MVSKISLTLATVEFFLVRHGQTESNAAHVIQGQQPGQLTKKGYEQAAKVGMKFQQSKTQFTEAYVSDLGRTQQTFSQMAEYIKIENVVAEPLLREKAAGVFEGGPYGAQAKMAKQLKIDVRKYKPDGGESHDEVLARAMKFITNVCDKFIPQNSKSTDTPRILVVTHGGFISEFLNACRIFTGRPLGTSDSANNGGIYIIQFQRNSKGGLKPKVVVENETTHLKSDFTDVKRLL